MNLNIYDFADEFGAKPEEIRAALLPVLEDLDDARTYVVEAYRQGYNDCRDEMLAYIEDADDALVDAKTALEGDDLDPFFVQSCVDEAKGRLRAAERECYPSSRVSAGEVLADVDLGTIEADVLVRAVCAIVERAVAAEYARCQLLGRDLTP
jgi:hypothetical protein